MKPRLREHISSFEKIRYMSDDDGARNNISIIDCSHGINPFGYSDSIDAKIVMSGLDADKYAPAPFRELTDAIVKHWSAYISLKSEDIRITTGAIGVIDSVNKIFIECGAAVLGYSPQFSEYINYVKLYGGTYESVQLRESDNLRFNAEELIAALRPRHRLLYLDNPNNPTGQVIPLEEIARVLDAAQQNNTCVLVDEAYGDFMAPENSAIQLIDRYANLIVARSFSKGYGIPGLRVGYMACSPCLLDAYDIAHEPYNNNVLGLKAAWLSLEDKDHLAQSLLGIQHHKRQFIECLRTLRVFETDMRVPILTLVHPDPEIDLYRELLSRGVLTISNFTGLGRNAVRLRVPQEIERLIGAIKTLD